jgi:putative phosphoribosyl transferase
MEPRVIRDTVAIDARKLSLVGEFSVPTGSRGIIVFAHGSGSSRASPRNRAVANALVEDGFATLLFDLLTPEEERIERYTRHLRFDLELLTGRLVATVDWINRQPRLASLPIGLFGASTGAAAALIASTRTEVAAVVSRGGRVDLAGAALPLVRCPTLLIVGGDDEQVLELNRRALREMTGPASLQIVPHASHLFEEPGTLAEAIRLASAWFLEHLAAEHPRPPRPRPAARP